MQKWLIYLLALVVVVGGSTAAFFEVQCARKDIEKRELNAQARKEAAGSFADSRRGTTHYEMAGPADARTVVLIPGFSVPYFLWDETFQPLVSAGFRVIRYDLYGRGYSDRPDTKYDAALFTEQLSDLLDGLHVERPVDLVASSQGGPIAVAYAAQHPERVRTVTLFDPGYHSGEPLPWRVRMPILGEYFMCTRIIPAITAGQKRDFIHPERYPKYFEEFAAQLRFKGTRAALLSTLRDFVARDDRPDYAQLGKSAKPVLLVWGTEDKDTPVSLSQAVLAAVPQAEFHPIAGGAHVAFFEHPEIVNPLLINFLKTH
jgi:pimeloyl-ACP methyl ester carboxylesterase